MMRELLAVGLLVLLIVFAVYCVQWAKWVSIDLTEKIDGTVAAAAAEDWDSALDRATAAKAAWLNARGFGKICLSHNMLDGVGEAMQELMEAAASEDAAELYCKAAYAREWAAEIYASESVNLGSLL